MLQTIRDKSQGLIAFLIIFFVCITFALWGIHNYFNGSSANDLVAKVNGQHITQQEFSASFSRLKQQIMMENPSLLSNQSTMLAVKKELLDSMVTSVVLMQAAQRSGFAVSQSLVELELANMPVFQVNGVFSKARFQQVLSNMMYTEDELVAMLRQTMLVAQVRTAFVAPAFALPYEVDRALGLVNEKRSFQYVVVPSSRYLSSSQPGEKAIAEYYATHLAEFAIPQKVSVQYIVLSLPDLIAKLHPTDAELQAYYQENIDRYTQQKKWTLAHLLLPLPSNPSKEQIDSVMSQALKLKQELVAGSDFSSFARQYSADNTTAAKGGLLGSVTLLQLPANWQQQLASLKEGEVSSPFQTPEGIELVKVISTTPAVVESYASVKTRVMHDFVQAKAEQRYAELSDQLSNLTFQRPDSLLPAAKALGLSIQSTAFFSQEGGSDAITKNPAVINAAFSADVLKAGNNSNLITLSDQSVLALRIKEHVPASELPLSVVKNAIAKKLTQQTASLKAKEQAKNLYDALMKGASLASLSSKSQLVMQSQSFLSRNNNGKINSALVHAAFGLSVPTANEVSAVVVPLNVNDSAVVQLTAVKQADVAAIPANVKKYYAVGIARNAGLLNYAVYVGGLKQKAHIKYYS